MSVAPFAAEVDFTTAYQPRVVANFSGMLCVDAVYQGELAFLLAVDAAAPDGDRLVGYTLLSNTKAVDQDAIKALLAELRAAGTRQRVRTGLQHRPQRLE